MLRTRVMPCLLLKDWGLVKTVRFKSPKYVGDPVNTVRIFNELEVDELVFLDIEATPHGKPIQFDLLAEIAGECFMPFTYGGGLRTLDDVARVLALGAEKVVINTHGAEDPSFITAVAKRFGSQSVVASIDAKPGLLGGYRVYTHGGRTKLAERPDALARRLVDAGAGEVLITAIHREGTFSGFDLDLTRQVAEAVDVPVIASGGAAGVEDLRRAVFEAGASALAVGSMVVYQASNRAVLINFPAKQTLKAALERRPESETPHAH
ncbi:MAG: AglZ/HisF2 family acetamidino modification protein [Desulfovibrionaceae bacterium]